MKAHRAREIIGFLGFTSAAVASLIKRASEQIVRGQQESMARKLFSEPAMNSQKSPKHNPVLDEEIPGQPTDTGDAAAEIETAQLQVDDEINLDDALDDDNENPVSHTLIEAAENRGEKSRSVRHKLDGEAAQALEH